MSDFLDTSKILLLGSFLDTVFAIMGMVGRAIPMTAQPSSVREPNAQPAHLWAVQGDWGFPQQAGFSQHIYVGTACKRLSLHSEWQIDFVRVQAYNIIEFLWEKNYVG